MVNNQTNADSINNTARVIEIEGKRFVAGLLWWPIDVGGNQKKEIAQFAQKQDMNLATVHTTAMGVMAGFAKAAPSQIKLYDGAWSLAPILAEKLGESWLGVFDLEDGNYVLVAVHEGAIVPGCDMVGDLEYIRSYYNEVSHTHNWDKVYVGDERMASLFDSDIVNKDLELKQVLSEKRWNKEYKLRSLQRSMDPRLVLAGIALLLVGGALYGWNWYSGQKAAQELARAQMEAQAKRLERADRDREAALDLVASLAAKPTWYDEPAAAAVLGSCAAAINQLPLTVAAWKITGASCDGNAVSASYERFAGTTILDFYQAAQALREAGVFSSVNAQADTAEVNVQLQTLPARGHEELLEEGGWTRNWIAHFQTLSVDSTLKNIPHPEPPPPDVSIVDLLGPEKAVPEQPWWSTHEWSYQADSVRPEQVLGAVPPAGFVVKSVDLTVEQSSWKWSAKGEIHVK